VTKYRRSMLYRPWISAAPDGARIPVVVSAASPQPGAFRFSLNPLLLRCPRPALESRCVDLEPVPALPEEPVLPLPRARSGAPQDPASALRTGFPTVARVPRTS